MATEVRWRRGTAEEHETFTGANGEVTVDTTNKTLRVHDGETPGGFPQEGFLVAPAFSPISWHAQTVDNSVTIPEDKNAWSFGPVIEIAEGQAVTVPESSFWTIANG